MLAILFEIVSGPTVDASVSKELVPDWRLQAAFQRGASADGAPGPQVVADSVAIAAAEIRFATTSDLEPESIRTEAFGVTAFYPVTGWSGTNVDAAAPDGDATHVLLTLNAGLAAGTRLRLIARGTGGQPLLGTDGQPLSGGAGASGAGDEGRDDVRMRTVWGHRTSTARSAGRSPSRRQNAVT